MGSVSIRIQVELCKSQVACKGLARHCSLSGVGRSDMLSASYIYAGMTNLLMGTDLTPQQLDYVKVAQASGNALM